MLNMQVVSASLRDGRRKGYVFSGGMALVIAFQAALAVLFADWMTTGLRLVPLIKSYAIYILALLAAGFFVKGVLARKQRQGKNEKPHTGSPFWRGVMLSAMNVLNIPFIFAIAGFLVSHDVLPESDGARLLYVPAVGLGAFATFCTYSRLAESISRNAAFFTRNIYFFIGGLLALGAVFEGVRVF